MKIQNKLFLFLFGFSLILVTVLVFLMQWSIGKGMVEYVVSKEIETLKPITSQLAKEYQVENSWQAMTGQHRKFRYLISQQLSGSNFEPNQKMPLPRHRPFGTAGNRPLSSKENMPPAKRPNVDNRPPPHAGKAHYALLDENKNLVVGNVLDELEYTNTEIKVDNHVIGYFAVSKRSELTQGYEVDFVQQQQHYLWLIALIVMFLVVLVTFPLARYIVEPIKLITQGMHNLTQGEYQKPITLKRQDELSELSRDYNELALTLAENETARKRWLANISHELRTPVAILRGELEAMLDKVRPLSLNNINSANDEVKHLQRLIDDLNLLTSADIGGMRYRKRHENLTLLIQNEIEKYKSYLANAGISLNFSFMNKEIDIYGDKTRLCQLFENIINNCSKYSAASVLNITLTVEKSESISVNNSNNVAVIKFEDDGVGVDEVHLPKLFEHLYRVEDSRNRKTGGSGLGLSICRHIVIAHQGEVIAQQSSLGGLAVVIKLPLG